MSSKTFENLPQDKQKKIASAIKKEFLTHPYGEVSINRIIKDADIPRGSIYQYFEGKEDMLLLVLKGYCTKIIALIRDTLKENNGDIFTTIERVLYHIFHEKEEHMGEHGYGLLFSDSRVAQLITNVSDRCNGGCPGEIMVVAAVRPELDFGTLDLKSAQEEDVFLAIVVDSLCRPVVQYLNDGVNRYAECMAKVKLLQEHFEKKKTPEPSDTNRTPA